MRQKVDLRCCNDDSCVVCRSSCLLGPNARCPNQSTKLDTDGWLFFELLRPLRRHGALKVILKDAYKRIPIVGWGMRGFGFILLRRNWAKDRCACRVDLSC